MVLIGLQKRLLIVKYWGGLTRLRPIRIFRPTTRVTSRYWLLLNSRLAFRTREVRSVFNIFPLLWLILSTFQIFLLFILFNIIKYKFHLISLFWAGLFSTLCNILVEIPVSYTCLSLCVSIESKGLLMVSVVGVRGLVVCVDCHRFWNIWFDVFWSF